MWTVHFAVDGDGRPVGKTRIDSYKKRHPAAVILMVKRLNMILDRLNMGATTEDALSFGWVHPEKGEVFGIDPIPGNPPLRMYCCLKPNLKKAVIFTIGEKKRQQADLKEVFKWAAAL